MIVKFVDAWFTVLAAATVWVAAGAGVVALAVVGVAAALRALWSASRARRAPRIHPTPKPPPHAPLRAHTQPLVYEETA